MAGARYVGRVRLLLRRHLLIHGKWYGALETRARPTGFPVEQFLGQYLSGGHPDAEARRAAAALSEELAAELRGRPLEPGGPWRRYGELCAALALAPEEADLLLVLLAAQADAGAAWMLRLLAGGDPTAGLPVEFLRAVLDPLSEAPEPTARALGPEGCLRGAGVVAARPGETLCLAPRAARYLLEGAAALAAPPPFADGVLGVDGCAELAHRAEAVLSDALAATRAALTAPVRLALLGEPGRGARWLAAWAAHAAGRPLLELSWAGLAGADPAALRCEVALRSAAVLVAGRPSAEALEAGVARLAGLPTEILCMQMPHPGTAALGRLMDATGAAAVALGDLPPEGRARAWRAAIERRREDLAGDVAGWPARLQVHRVGVEEMDQALQAGMAAAPTDVLSGVEAACEALAAPWLSRVARRLALPDGETAALPPPLRARVAALRQALHGGGPGGLAVLTLEGDAAATTATAALLGAALAVPVYRLPLAALALLPPQRALGRVRRALAAARSAGAALLLQGLDELLGAARALERPLWEAMEAHEGIVLVSASSRGG